MKKIICLSIMMLFVSFSSIALSAQPAVKVKVDDKYVSFPDAQPFIDQNGRTQVPIRFISEQLGSEVSWDDNERKVTITKGSDTLVLKIGESIATKNGKTLYFDTISFIKQDRTFVPLRFIGETLGVKVSWLELSKTVEIVTKTEYDSTIPEEFKTILKTVPETAMWDSVLIYSNDGNPSEFNNNFNIGTDNTYEISLGINSDSYDTKTLEAVRTVFKVYFPNEFGKAHSKLLEVVKMPVKMNPETLIYESGVSNLYFDNRYFKATKYENGIDIYIGKVGVKY